MIYFVAPGFCIQTHNFQSAEWGSFVRYIEIANDQYANRQVEVFDNGNILHYDRSHWCDDFAMLLPIRFSRKPKWKKFFPDAQEITPAVFEKLWRKSEASHLWTTQAANSRVHEYGALPWWLAAKC